MKVLTLFLFLISTLFSFDLREICSEYSEVCKTKCCDGNYSTSSGAGSCSYHGGVCDTQINSSKNSYYLLNYIIDGDTILFNDFKCRLYGIDTPESQYGSKLDRDREMCSVSENFMLKAGKEATNYTKSLLTFQNYQIEIKGEDFYGRKECIIYLEDNSSLNEKLIENGYAIAWSEYIDEEYLKEIYLYKQNLAKEKQIGLWKNYESVIGCLAEKRELNILEIALNKNWNLIGVDRDIDNLYNFLNENISEIFIYKNEWLNLNQINKLDKFDGFWIKTKEKSYLKNSNKKIDKNFIIKEGWQLKSFDRDMDNFEIFKECINAIWIYRDNLWLIYNFDLKEFDKIYKSEGFWINSKKECEINFDN